MGDTFPKLRLSSSDGRELTLPRDLDRPFSVVLINRGAWCPYCTAQLTAFQAGLPKLAARGIGVVSLSADTRVNMQQLVRKHGLEFPVAGDAPLDAIAEQLGVYYQPASERMPAYLHAAGFVLGGSGEVLTAVYSSGAIGRLVWQDVLGFVEYIKAHA
ncbi:MAG TPA: redoxin domain-containing protein [Polyangiaceae bacterium]|nr:redoxin domain-containing protein [Polyangiaceae bacterium]